jgi:diguanylate cyclase (GGDEF)-like protein
MSATVMTRRAALLTALGLVVAFTVVLRTHFVGSFTVRAIDDLGEAAAALLAAGPCAWRARRTTGRWRSSWALIAAGLAAWGVGELLWSYYELIGSQDTPFPSPADIGYLLFPALVLTGLLVRPSAAFAGRGRFRILLDGTMVAGSLFIVSWSTTLGAVFAAGASTTLALVTGLAYPVTDLIMLTIVVMIGARSRPHPGLFLLFGGIAAMAVADSAFYYLTTAGTYQTGAISDIGWVVAFFMIGLSALHPTAADKEVTVRTDSLLSLAVPYVLVLVGTGIAIVEVVRLGQSMVTLAVAGVSIGALLVRQLITVLDNRRLAANVIAAQAELHYRAFHDGLTGLANRNLFYDRLGHALALHERDKRPVSVLFIDLDDFKAVNDSYGHDAGDTLLVAIANRLAGVIRFGDTIARLGGDEFAVLLEDEGDPAWLAERVQHALATPVHVAEQEIPMRASVGITTLDPSDTKVDVGELLKRADLAMYAAKRDGKGRSVCYTTGLRAPLENDLELRLRLAEDLRAGQVRTAYQPIVRADTRAAYAVEALARWNYRGQAVAPDRFIPLAHRHGLLGDLDMLMLNNALDDNSKGTESGLVLVTVNLALSSMADESLPELIGQSLRRAAFPAGNLVVEVSESEAFTEPRAFECLAELRRMGIRVAIDDFGVGYSNLSRIDQLRPDIVKLDRSFVAPFADRETSRSLLAAVIALAHTADAVVVGEGVESKVQADILTDLGCDALQGFYIGRPAIPATTTWIAA